MAGGKITVGHFFVRAADPGAIGHLCPCRLCCRRECPSAYEFFRRVMV